MTPGGLHLKRISIPKPQKLPCSLHSSFNVQFHIRGWIPLRRQRYTVRSQRKRSDQRWEVAQRRCNRGFPGDTFALRFAVWLSRWGREEAVPLELYPQYWNASLPFALLSPASTDCL